MPIQRVNTSEIDSWLWWCRMTLWVKGFDAVSTFLVAPSGSAKSAIMEAYRQTSGVHFEEYCTHYGILEGLLPEIRGIVDPKIDVICIPDMTVFLLLSKDVRNAVIGIIHLLVGDGIQNVDSFNFGKEKRIKLPYPVRCQFFLGTTPESIQYHWVRWWGMGFLSRFTVLHFEQSRATTMKIREARSRVNDGAIAPTQFPAFPDAPVEVHLKPEDYMILARAVPDIISNLDIGHRNTGLRLDTQLATIVRAKALSEGRDIVTTADVAEVLEIALKYMVWGKNKDIPQI